MPINWRTDYAIRLLYELARLGEGTRATVRELAESADVPYDYARTIVRDLVASGILTSRRGVGGGVELACASSGVSVLDVFKAMKEPASLALCTDAGGDCGRADCCPMHNVFWVGLDEIIQRHLSSITLASAVETGREIEANTGT